MTILFVNIFSFGIFDDGDIRYLDHINETNKSNLKFNVKNPNEFISWGFLNLTGVNLKRKLLINQDSDSR